MATNISRCSVVMVYLMCLIAVHSTTAGHIWPIRTFTMTVTNNLKAPMFNNSITLPIKSGSRLISYMEAACDIDQSKFKFTVTYAKHGYFVNAFNDVYSVWNAVEKKLLEDF